MDLYMHVYTEGKSQRALSLGSPSPTETLKATAMGGATKNVLIHILLQPLTRLTAAFSGNLPFD